MILFEQALEIVKKSVLAAEIENVPFSRSNNRILAEDILADTDMPPFDKSAMDGFACRREDLEAPLNIIETVPAGYQPVKIIKAGQCARIMTGSMIPEGADCVVKVEETELLSPEQVRFAGRNTHHNICYQGEDVKARDKVLGKGSLIQPQHIAVMASVGKVRVNVYKSLSAGILSTGDELVEPVDTPGPSAIRNSNAWQLAGQCEKMGLVTNYYGIARDEKESLKNKISLAEKENNLILLTGGVSMGDYDLVPEVLHEMNYQVKFRKIAVQPGSPTLFAAKGNIRVFALPGNPVSSFVQFEMLVKPFAFLSMNYDHSPVEIDLPLATPYFRKKAERLSLVPVVIRNNKVHLLEYHGSAHIHAYAVAEAIMSIPIGTNKILEGEPVHVRLL